MTILATELRDSWCSLDLRSMGTLSLPGNGNATLTREGMEPMEIRQPELRLHTGALVTVWFDTTTAAAIIVTLYGDCAVCVRARTGQVSNVTVRVEPSCEMGLWRTDLFETLLGPILIHESGVIAFNHDSSLRWRADFDSLSWVYEGVDDRSVVFNNEFLGTATFDLTTGARI